MSALALTADQIRATIQRCKDAILALGFKHPHFLMVHDRVRNLWTVDLSVKTMAIDEKGRIYVNPTFARQLPGDQLGGVICHELLHLAYDHATRKGTRDHKRWNIACDMAINHALRADGIALPPKALYPPTGYTGEIRAEPLYDFLAANPEAGEGAGEGEGEGEPNVGEGCGLRPAPEGSEGAEGANGSEPKDGEGLGQGETWADVGAQARAMARMIGSGSSAVATLLTPGTPRIDWRKVLRQGFQIAASARIREVPTYSKAARRSAVGDASIILPGWTGTQPTVAVVIDVSGSMDRKWVDLIVAECVKLTQTFPGSRAYLVSHTDQVCWEGWITDGNARSAIDASVQFSGGTHATPAYDAVRAVGARFDALVHFTDMEIETPWPSVPAKRLIVGAFGSGANGDPYSKPPAGTMTIPCMPD